MVKSVTQEKMCVTFGDPKRQRMGLSQRSPELMHRYQHADFNLVRLIYDIGLLGLFHGEFSLF